MVISYLLRQLQSQGDILGLTALVSTTASQSPSTGPSQPTTSWRRSSASAPTISRQTRARYAHKLLVQDTSYRWDAKNNPLEVTEARVVVTTAAEPAEDSATPERIGGVPVSTVSEAIIDSIRSLDTKVGRLGWTIVVLLWALLIELWRRL
jgi:hypothetical protein